MEKVISIRACIFKRKEKSEWENGVMFNEGSILIDMDCKAVDVPIYNYVDKGEELSVMFKPEKVVIKNHKYEAKKTR